MSEQEDGAGATATGWSRIPRWQHLVLIGLCVAVLIAAVVNVAVAGSWSARGLHTLFGLLVAAALASLVMGFRRRPPE